MKKLNVLLTTAAILALTGCSSNSKPAETEATTVETTAAETTEAETTAAAAEKKDASGTLTVYTSQPEADIQSLVEEYNKSCPDVKVEIFRSGTEEVVSKVLAEKEAGSVLADVLLVSDAATFESLKAKDILMSYESPELAEIDPSFYDADHTYTGTKIITTGIAVNTDLISNVPESLADLAKASTRTS